MHLAVGLAVPTCGELAVLGGLAPGSLQVLGRAAFVAQDPSLYPNLSVADTLRLAGNLSSRWDEADAWRRLAALDIPLRRKVGQLSGGQQAQVALAVALARHPGLLILDGPLANLDPLARHEFMATVMAAVVEDNISVVLSSHVLAELERCATT
jgi:ABC-2 type transport system ATP-binding protein